MAKKFTISAHPSTLVARSPLNQNQMLEARLIDQEKFTFIYSGPELSSNSYFIALEDFVISRWSTLMQGQQVSIILALGKFLGNCTKAILARNTADCYLPLNRQNVLVSTDGTEFKLRNFVLYHPAHHPCRGVSLEDGRTLLLDLFRLSALTGLRSDPNCFGMDVSGDSLQQWESFCDLLRLWAQQSRYQPSFETGFSLGSALQVDGMACYATSANTIADRDSILFKFSCPSTPFLDSDRLVPVHLGERYDRAETVCHRVLHVTCIDERTQQKRYLHARETTAEEREIAVDKHKNFTDYCGGLGAKLILLRKDSSGTHQILLQRAAECCYAPFQRLFTAADLTREPDGAFSFLPDVLLQSVFSPAAMKVVIVLVENSAPMIVWLGGILEFEGELVLTDRLVSIPFSMAAVLEFVKHNRIEPLTLHIICWLLDRTFKLSDADQRLFEKAMTIV